MMVENKVKCNCITKLVDVMPNSVPESLTEELEWFTENTYEMVMSELEQLFMYKHLSKGVFEL